MVLEPTTGFSSASARGNETASSHTEKVDQIDMASEASTTSSVTLDQLPEEVLHIIAAFLEPADVIGGLMRTNEHLHRIFSDEEYWRIRIKRRWPSTYPIISDRTQSRNVWKKRACTREAQYNKFSSEAKTPLQNVSFGAEHGGFHFSDINAMCFINNGDVLASGGRDRQLILWDITAIKRNYEQKVEPVSAATVQTILHTHGGWVWSVQNVGNSLSAGSWDGAIHIFDLDHSTDKSNNFKCEQAVTCHLWHKDLVIAGTIMGSIVVFDVRAGPKSVYKRKQSVNQDAVLGVQCVDDYVVTVGADKKFHVLDLGRQDFVIKRSIPNNDFGTKIVAKEGHVWVGTKHGQILLYDAEEFELVENFTEVMGHTEHITGLHFDAGHLATCGLDRKAQMVQPTKSAETIWKTKSDTGFTAMDFSKDCTMALAWGSTVGLWW
ncbi:hypothetical protein RvY_12781-1 [Ramazzottius varieornatus]|uniref:F-box domain-containing protein n=1 Tax=Ramazzottius varieornatus TaxID=947166 RepID=A0A1D1VT99_RAMVA|nr:hypothetical protein RvY_12781-1 [Ramazzottius varieornatus]